MRPLARRGLAQCLGRGLSSDAGGFDYQASHWAEKRANRERLSDLPDLRTRRQESGEQFAHAGERNEELKGISTMIRTLSRQRRWQEALHLFSSVEHPDAMLTTSAMDACAKSMKLRQTKELFERMPTKTIPAYNVFINLLGRLKRVEDAEDLVQRMRTEGLEPTVITMSSLINGYGMVHNAAAAVRVLDDMRSASLQTTTVCYGAAVSACARAGDYLRVEELIQQMDAQSLQVDQAICSSLILSCARGKDEARADKAFEELRRRGFTPDVIAYTCRMTCVKGRDALPKVQELFAQMQGEGIQPDSFAYNCLLQAAIHSRNAKRFDEILEEMAAAGLSRTRETECRIQEMRRVEQEDEEEEKLSATASNPPAEPPRELPLPEGWCQHVDPASGHTYYWMASDPAGTTTWQRPG